jgi:hypothetical protein
VVKHYTVYLQNKMAITFPADLEIIAFVGEDEEGCLQTEL